MCSKESCEMSLELFAAGAIITPLERKDELWLQMVPVIFPARYRPWRWLTVVERHALQCTIRSHGSLALKVVTFVRSELATANAKAN